MIETANTTVQLVAVILYFACMVAIGYYAYRRTTDLTDYMLAGRNLRPSTAALSAGASDMSGWLMMGLPGAIYARGLVEAWIAIGLTIGAWLNWKFVAPRLRAYTEVASNSITIPSFLEARFRTGNHALRIIAGLIILAFFIFYVSSGLVAGGQFFTVAFGLDYLQGMLIVAGVTVVYTLVGGFLGASLTDVVQGTMMFLGLLLVPLFAVVVLGGVGDVGSGVSAADAVQATAAGAEVDRMSFLAGASALGIISAAAWGLGYFGQPHIIVRFMAMRSAADAPAARRIGIGWMALAGAGAIFTGLVGIAYFHGEGVDLTQDGREEQVFLLLSQALFHPFVAALLLAAVLAAVMSTISSQLVVCSSALVEDIYLSFGRTTSRGQQLMLGRGAVLAVAIIATLLALDTDSTILDLVGFAWAGFGAAFGPVILLSLYWRRLTMAGALAAMITGAVTVGIWGNVDALSGFLYEIVPGFVLATLAAWVVSRLTWREDDAAAEVAAEFDAMLEASGARTAAR
ncbi:sodium/proline symporter PutP [Nesterenkonia sp. CL21]|uniref:sodium/proline symporter PutP n=1 Tax=unclassified Nesterenkonia TaxID=2629769 RepID=UPI002879EA9F|nr:sodium/proline symporter PutP [Nesterenkonia sp. CL21]MDS2171645.1 sodium/proline symporter PutP [Nesterenkonia sp. CL21]